MGVIVSNVKIVQCTIFCWNLWTTNWIRHGWNRSATNFGTPCICVYLHFQLYTRTEIHVSAAVFWHGCNYF